MAEVTELYRLALKDKGTGASKALSDLLMVSGQSASVIIINYGRGLLLGSYLLMDVISLEQCLEYSLKKKATIFIKSNTYFLLW